jgi:drug/metabolite transporter (DMT)-like permease
MFTVLLGLFGALAYGSADFAGGLAARRLRPLAVTSLTATIGIAPLLVGLLLLGGRFTLTALVWGAVAGVSGSVGVLLLYAALAIGPMSVLSPVTSVFSAILPVIVAVVFGTRLSLLAVAAIVIAVLAVVLVSASRSASGVRLTLRGLVMAVLAGFGFGGLVLAYDMTSPGDGVAPLVVARVVQALLMVAALLITRKRSAPTLSAGSRIPALSRRFGLIVITCGILDATANVFIQAALHSNPNPTTLPVVSVLNALYPVGTIILASIVLHERLTKVQGAGIGLGIAASVVLAFS